MPEIPEKYKVFFLTRVPFPYGLAQTNRLISIAAGLVNAGCDVTVICLKPTENVADSRNYSSLGTYNQVKFIYTSGTSYRGKSFLRRSYLFITGIMSATTLLVKEHKSGKIQAAFMGVTGSLNILWFGLICRILKIKYLQERSEYPFIKASRKSWFDKPALFIYLNLVCKLFDGFVVITRRLQQYFTPYLRENCPVYLLPILVEPERFENLTETASEIYIAYCGSMEGDKDGIPILTDAFHFLMKDYPDLKLYLVGPTQFEGFRGLKENIVRKGLELNVIFTGTADRDQLPRILSNAHMLVLARPGNRQSEAGFPTKLGEYLATGKPVVVTSVGEIPDYLHHDVNAFIAKPNDAADFALKMKQVLQNYEHALEIGKQGQILAQTIFNYKIQGKQLADWLQKL